MILQMERPPTEATSKAPSVAGIYRILIPDSYAEKVFLPLLAPRFARANLF
jgi:hypothetical protein